MISERLLNECEDVFNESTSGLKKSLGRAIDHAMNKLGTDCPRCGLDLQDGGEVARRAAKHDAAVKTLEAAGYTYHGGELWKPPLGPSAKPLVGRIAELEAALRKIASMFDESWLNGSLERHAGDLARAALQPKPTKE